MRDISFPLIFCIRGSVRSRRFFPLKRILPETILPGGGTSLNIDSAVIVLPQPLSPTSARTLPFSIFKLTPFTAGSSVWSMGKYVCRSWSWRIVSWLITVYIHPVRCFVTNGTRLLICAYPCESMLAQSVCVV